MAIRREGPATSAFGRGVADLRERRFHRTVRRGRDRLLLTPAPRRFASFGDSVIVPPTRIENPHRVSIGDRVVVLEHTWLGVVEHFDSELDPRLEIGDDVRIGRGCQFSVAGEMVIEDRVIIGDFVHVADTFHPYEAEHRMPALVRPRPVRVGAGAVIGSHAVVLPGVTVGPGAYVDHHAVVREDVEAGSFFSGAPPRGADRQP